MKHLTRHILFCVFLLSVIVLTPSNTNADVEMPKSTQTIQVSPGDSIQQALNAAGKTKPGQYTKVLLKPGETYYINEPLQVYSNTIIEASGATIEKTYDTAISKTSGLLQNVKGTSAGGYDLAKNIYIHGGTWTGGDLSQATDSGTNIIFVHVEELYIWDANIKNAYCGHLVELNAVKNAVIENCSFSGRKSLDSSSTDIAFQLDIADEADDNMDAPDHDSVPDGYLKDGTSCQNISFINNKFNVDTDSGLETFRSAVGANKLLVSKKNKYMENITISGNTITETSEVAILARGFKSGTITNNTITNAGKKAITAEKCFGGIISGNTIKDTNDIAIYCSNWINGNDGIAVLNNQITNVGTKGILYESATGTDVTGNTISNCSGSPLAFMKGASVTGSVANNTLTSAGSHGVYISDSNINLIDQNTLNNIPEHGIILEGGSIIGKVSGNTIDTCGKSGIFVSQNSIVNNNIEGNTIRNLANENSNGIYIYSGKVGKAITGNTILNIGKNGIYIQNGSVGDVSGNKIQNAKTSGIAVNNSTFGKISGNTISGSNRGVNIVTGSMGSIETNEITGCTTAVHISSDSKVSGSDQNAQPTTKTDNTKINVTKINVTNAFTIGVKESLTLKPEVLPVNATNKSVTYSSSNKKVATVSGSGKVTGKKAGTAFITIKAANGIKKTVKITVKKAPKKVSFSKKSLTLKLKKSKKLKIKFSKGTASYKITWKSSKKKIVSVSNNGTVRALKKGKAVITATTYNKKKAKITITVK